MGINRQVVIDVDDTFPATLLRPKYAVTDERKTPGKGIRCVFPQSSVLLLNETRMPYYFTTEGNFMTV